MKFTKFAACAGSALAIATGTAIADTDSPVGTYVVETITETVNGFSCTAIQQSGVEIDCDSTRIAQFRADGTVVGRNRSAPTRFLTDSDGFWKQRANGKVIIESIFQLFDETGQEEGFVVGFSKIDFENDYDSYEGTFESETFLDGQDILDENATPTSTLEGTVTARRLFKR